MLGSPRKMRSAMQFVYIPSQDEGGFLFSTRPMAPKEVVCISRQSCKPLASIGVTTINPHTLPASLPHGSVEDGGELGAYLHYFSQCTDNALENAARSDVVRVSYDGEARAMLREGVQRSSEQRSPPLAVRRPLFIVIRAFEGPNDAHIISELEFAMLVQNMTSRPPSVASPPPACTSVSPTSSVSPQRQHIISPPPAFDHLTPKLARKSTPKTPKRATVAVQSTPPAEQQKAVCFCSGECVVCLDRRRAAMAFPCGHLIVCAECARQLNDQAAAASRPSCPFCQKTVQRFVTVSVA